MRNLGIYQISADSECENLAVNTVFPFQLATPVYFGWFLSEMDMFWQERGLILAAKNCPD